MREISAYEQVSVLVNRGLDSLVGRKEMTMDNNDTEFAPAERADAESVQRDAEALQSAVLAEHVARVIPSIVMILNRQRQVVWKNQRLKHPQCATGLLQPCHRQKGYGDGIEAHQFNSDGRQKTC